ncbi:MAG: M56 family metallopeptidase, partial [Pseudomonadota bacterium]
MLALVLTRFLAGSLLAAMGDACGGIFEAGHGFLAAGRWNYLLAVVAAAAFLFQLVFLFFGTARLLSSSERLKRLGMREALSCPALGQVTGWRRAGRVRLIPDEGLGAMTVGIFRPRIVLHGGLVRALSADELRAVVEHEDAHRRGRDNMMVAAAKAVTLTLFYFPWMKRAFQEMVRSLERAADGRAAAATGGPLHVAS